MFKEKVFISDGLMTNLHYRLSHLNVRQKSMGSLEEPVALHSRSQSHPNPIPQSQSQPKAESKALLRNQPEV